MSDSGLKVELPLDYDASDVVSRFPKYSATFVLLDGTEVEGTLMGAVTDKVGDVWHNWFIVGHWDDDSKTERCRIDVDDIDIIRIF